MGVGRQAEEPKEEFPVIAREQPQVAGRRMKGDMILRVGGLTRQCLRAVKKVVP